MTEVVWTGRALSELQLIRDYIRQFSPVAAGRVAGEIMRAGNGLATFPRRGRKVPRTDMREITTGYPYVIRYRVNGDEVFILRIRHTSRRPTTP